MKSRCLLKCLQPGFRKWREMVPELVSAKPLSTCKNAGMCRSRLQAGSMSSFSLSLSLESEWGCVYPTFTLKISSSDAADTGSFNPLSSSSSTVKSPEMALRISGPMSCNVRRPACGHREAWITCLPHWLGLRKVTFIHVRFPCICVPAEKGSFWGAP